MIRLFVAAALGAAFGLFGYAAAFGITGSWPAAALAFAAVFAAVALWVRQWPEASLDATAFSKPLAVGSAVGAVVALVLLARLTVFMVDPARSSFSFVPGSTWEIQHSCTTAYFVAAQAEAEGGDVFDLALYNAPDDDPARPRKPRKLGAFNVDVYEYPPQFLLVPQLVRIVAPEFVGFRALWYGLGGALLLFANVAVARFLGVRALLLIPLAWLMLPTFNVLQKGNVQTSVIAASMLAMLLFERGRNAAGGALLALSTVGKIYPGLLIVYLIARRQWRAVGWTVAFGVAFSLATLALSGWGAYADFLRHLPGLLSGEAFPAFRNPAAIASNFSIPGLVFKLKLFGVPGMGFTASKVVGWVYMLAGTALVVLAARRTLRDDEKPVVWMAILILATLRSPFLPAGYGAVPPLWQLTLLAAACTPTARATVLTLLAWAGLNVYWPIDWGADPRLLAIVYLIPQSITVGMAVVPLGRRR